MDNDFSQLERGVEVAERRQFPAGISQGGGTYCSFEAWCGEDIRTGS